MRLAPAAVLFLTLVATPALAQERLFLFVDSTASLVEISTSEENFGAVQRSIRFRRGTRAVPIAGGRYLLMYSRWQDEPTLVGILDTRTFSASAIPQWTFPEGVAFARDDFEPRVFYRTATHVGVIEAPTFVPRVFAVDAQGPHLFGTPTLLPPVYAFAARTLFVTRETAPLQFDVVAIDVDTGSIRGTIPGLALELFVDNEKREIVIPTAQLSGTVVRTYDMDTLQLLAANAVPFRNAWPFDTWTLDTPRNQIIGRLRDGSDNPNRAPWMVALDADDLRLKAILDFAPLRGNSPPAHMMGVMPSTVRNRAFIAIGWLDYSMFLSMAPFVTPGSMFLIGVEASTLQPVSVADLVESGAAVPSFAQAVLLTPPLPPTPLTLQTTGRRAQLSWKNPGDTYDFVIEVGTIPGRSNIGIFHVGNVTSFSSDVPPGTYYVRVRALNDVGASLPSNEVVISVR